MAEGKLNKRQQKFLELYLSGKMPVDAYMEAYGSSKRVAQVSAYRLLENVSIQEAVAEFEQREKERVQKRLDRLIIKAIDNVESAMNLDEDDPSLTFFKMMAIQHKTKTAENHLKRMGFGVKPNDEMDHNINIKFTFEGIDLGKFPKPD